MNGRGVQLRRELSTKRRATRVRANETSNRQAVGGKHETSTEATGWRDYLCPPPPRLNSTISSREQPGELHDDPPACTARVAGAVVVVALGVLEAGEERAALGGGGIFGKSGFDLHLVPGAKLARGGNHGVAELALSVGARGAEHGGDAGLRAGARDDTRR